LFDLHVITNDKRLTWALGGVLVASLAAYILTKLTLFAGTSLLSFLALVLVDAAPKKMDKDSLSSTLKETLIAIAVAAAIWVGLCIILQTSSPIDVVPSCSMLPLLERGDLIIIQGGTINAPSINTNQFTNLNAQKKQCTIERGGTSIQTMCTSAIIAVNQSFGFNSSNDVIVYEATPSSYGLIVHRAWLAIEDNEETRYVTKGDNNQIIDYEGGIEFPKRSKVHGKVILRIPYVGLLKLFLFGQFDEPPGCDTRTIQ